MIVTEPNHFVTQRPIFTAGYDAMCHCHTCEEECTVVEILSVVDRKTGAKKRQRFAKEGAMVTAKFKVGDVEETTLTFQLRVGVIGLGSHA